MSKNSKTVFSCSKDKKVKIWDWVKQEQTKVLAGHSDSVESIALNQDETILFSGSLDATIGLWNIEKAYCLCTLNADFPIRTLRLSNDNDFLIALSPVHDEELT